LPAQQYVFRTYRQPEGLKNLGVRAMAKDRFGFLWMVTENGVYRFLGTGFERFGKEQGIAELTVQDVVADSDGTVWVGTDKNVYRWDGNRFQPAGSQSISVEQARQMAVEDANHLLVIEHGILYRLAHDAAGRMLSFSAVLPDALLQSKPELSQAESVAVVNERPGDIRIWLGCGKRLYSFPGGALELDSNTVTEWGKEQGLPEDSWSGMLLDHGGTLWVGGETHIAVLPHESSRFEDRSIVGGGPGTVYRHAPFLEDREGRILVAAREGLARWEGANWRVIGVQDGLPRTSQVVGMALDVDGDLWLASRGEGLVGWSGYENWEGWSDSQGLPSPVVWGIALGPSGEVLLGTEGGLARIDGHGGRAKSLAHGRWSLGQVSAIEPMRDGTMLAGTFSGEVLRVEPKNGRTTVVAKIPDYVMSILEDSAGRVYLSSKRGIYRRDPGDGRTAVEPVAAANALMGSSQRVETSCASPDGSLWFLVNNRLLRERDGEWSAPPVDGFSGVHGAFLALACSKDSSVWITGDQTGIWQLTANGGRMQATQLDLPAELRTLAPLAILVDHRGWVWVGTDLGLVVWNGLGWRHLTQESGLIWNDVDEDTMREAADGSLWIGTSNGVAHLMHPERVFDSTPLSVAVTGISHGAPLDATRQQITLPWGGLPLDFQFSSPVMRNRSELIFAYRMKGLHSEWIENRNGQAVFSGLPPGDYALEVMARNSSLGSQSQIVSLHVTILAPWWRSRWFLGFCAVCLVLFLVWVNRLYANHLQARSRELERLVMERTRELEMSREQLRIQATHDGLTGMLNRGAVLRALGVALERASREKRTLVVALVDLDLFKGINDTYGHLAGDAALRWFAAAVGAAIRPYDSAGRYGGEEFLLVLPEIPREAVESRLANLHAAITGLHVHERGQEFTVNCTLGATVLEPTTGRGTVETLLTIADHALYEAKAQGRNRVVLYSANDRMAV
jgi:diguanylate cyclase (GGDEF)-like protein